MGRAVGKLAALLIFCFDFGLLRKGLSARIRFHWIRALLLDERFQTPPFGGFWMPRHDAPMCATPIFLVAGAIPTPGNLRP